MPPRGKIRAIRKTIAEAIAILTHDTKFTRTLNSRYTYTAAMTTPTDAVIVVDAAAPKNSYLGIRTRFKIISKGNSKNISIIAICGLPMAVTTVVNIRKTVKRLIPHIRIDRGKAASLYIFE